MAGIYLHIPFCRKACHYCNFHFSTLLQNKNGMVQALLREIEQESVRLDGQRVDTIYFGGGTPSLLTVSAENITALSGGTEKRAKAVSDSSGMKDRSAVAGSQIGELNLLIEAIRRNFTVAADAEITLEANPDDINEEILEGWKAAGVNRLSIGVQSFREEDLLWMNRAHTAAEAERCILLAKAAGFRNLTIDLIYGTPGLTDEAWEGNVRKALELGVPHLSCYALTVEPKTALHHMVIVNNMPDTDPEQQSRQFLLLMDWMEGAGYEHYEISNFARPGWRSRHNSSYWRGVEYLGIGPGAHSYSKGSGAPRRRWNIANNALYMRSFSERYYLQNEVNELTANERGLDATEDPKLHTTDEIRLQIPLIYEEEILTRENRFNEYVMTALRTMEGIDLEFIREEFGGELVQNLIEGAEKFNLEEERLMINEKNVRLTNKGKLFADGIAAELFI
ncbi:coproporphyrinogen III oxidase family protein [Flavihumibacter sediminis]|nr:coproporphyrinogen III oxidase family protein [Flavihumibacter sediminis]